MKKMEKISMIMMILIQNGKKYFNLKEKCATLSCSAWGDSMEKFTRTLRGYDPDEVNSFIDQVISQVEIMVNDIKSKNKKIAELSKLEEENAKLKEKLATYERMEGTLNRAIIMAEKTSEQIKLSAHQESETIINDAKRNANRIVNDALLKAEKTEMEADMLRRNITIFKRKLRSIIESQLEMVNDIEKVDF